VCLRALAVLCLRGLVGCWGGAGTQGVGGVAPGGGGTGVCGGGGGPGGGGGVPACGAGTVWVWFICPVRLGGGGR
jgi:hypothetical protein